MPCSSNGSHFPIKPVLLITFPGCAHVALRGKLTLLAPVMRCQGLRDCGGNENMWWFARSTAGVLLWLFLTGLVFVKAWHFFFFLPVKQILVFCQWRRPGAAIWVL